MALGDSPTTGPGWGNTCRECFGSKIEWPGMRRCGCAEGKPTRMTAEEMFPRTLKAIRKVRKEHRP